MKILIIHNKYGKFSGEESVVESQIKMLRDNGHKVITYFRSSVELETMKYSKLKAFFSGFNNPKSIKEIKKLLRNEKPDIVHVHNLYPLISPAVLPVIKKMKFPIVMTVHNYRLLCPNGLFFTNGKICEKCTGVGKEFNCISNNCEGSLLKSTGYALRNYWARTKGYYLENIDSFLCLTTFQKNKLISNGFLENKCEVIPNFFNNEINKLKENTTIGNYVVFAGRISPEKGIPDLLNAACKLSHIPFKLAGSVRAGYLKEFDIPENVTLVGMLDTVELQKLYSNARVYLHTSVCYEGFPMVFPEAMAHKLPIIAPNMAGYSEIVVNNENGLLFEPGNIISLTETIQKLWKDPLLCNKLGNYAFEMVQKEYSLKVYYKKLVTVYQSVIYNF